MRWKCWQLSTCISHGAAPAWWRHCQLHQHRRDSSSSSPFCHSAFKCWWPLQGRKWPSQPLFQSGQPSLQSDAVLLRRCVHSSSILAVCISLLLLFLLRCAGNAHSDSPLCSQHVRCFSSARLWCAPFPRGRAASTAAANPQPFHGRPAIPRLSPCPGSTAPNLPPAHLLVRASATARPGARRILTGQPQSQQSIRSRCVC